MNVSVLIPTRGRAEKLSACLRHLRTQSWQPGDEVVVGFDGEDPRAADAAREAFGVCDATLRLEAMPREGYIAVRHRLLPTLTGEGFISLNDDVRPAPGFIESHRRALRRGGHEAAYVGFSPFARFPDPTMIDRLVAQSSWVFFYEAMLAEFDPDRDWGFRHLFGLNFSARTDAVRAAGGFTAMPDIYGYDDIELGHRLASAGLAIRFNAQAVALHDHRMTSADLLRREHALGVAAAHYAAARPVFAADVFGRDILDDGPVRELRALGVDRESLDSFLALDRTSGGDNREEPRRLWERFRPLKRACWARGVLETIDSGRLAELFPDGHRSAGSAGQRADAA